MSRPKRPTEAFPSAPPAASTRARKIANRVLAPVDAFLARETAGGIVLLIAAAIALTWANSPWAPSYGHLWHTPIALTIGDWSLEMSLNHWINDGLMTFFFLVVGFEIKREIVQGELSDLRRATLPLAAALGGMIVPALIFFALNTQPPASDGWGIPMATDIAFAVGILTLLGKRVPASMRILLLAIAIIDDLGAILVIAIFYTPSVDMGGLVVLAGGVVVLAAWLKFGVRPGPLYLVPLAILWAGLFKTGVHPTLSGVIVGLATPVRPWLQPQQFATIAENALSEFRDRTTKGHDEHDLVAPLRRLAVAGREAMSPVVRGQSEMHPWVAFVIMPLFALANSGVDLGGVDLSSASAIPVMTGVAVGLAVGKPVGVLLFSWICVRAGLCALPRGITWSGVAIVGLTAGIGFTMSIFIAELAFAGQPGLLAVSKLAILIATAAAAILGLLVGRIVLKELDPEIAKMTPAQVEASTEF